MAEAFELAPQGLEILDDAVVHDGDPVGRDRMGIGLGRQAMGRPAGMPDADHALHRLVVEPPGEVGELALGAAALDAAVDQGRDPGRIIAAVFEAAQPFDEPRRDRVLGDDSDDAAHQSLPPQPSPDLRGAPRLVDLLAAGDRQRVRPGRRG